MQAPKGVLIPIGGKEQRLDHQADESTTKKQRRQKFEVLRRFMQEMRGADSQIEIIPVASQAPEQRGKDYLTTFTDLGCSKLGVINPKRIGMVDNQAYLTRLLLADGVIFTGGNQMKLTEYFLGSRFLEVLRERFMYDKHFVIAGTSAGAMAMSDVMLYGGTSKEAMMRARAKLTKGLGFVQHCIIDSHFVNRGRFGRLAVAVTEHPKLLGIGLGEDTGLVIREGHIAECIGNEHVMLFDGSNMTYRSIEHVERNHAASFAGMNLKLLSRGYVYDLLAREFVYNPHAKESLPSALHRKSDS
jgi:cyanophycinase